MSISPPPRAMAELHRVTTIATHRPPRRKLNNKDLREIYDLEDEKDESASSSRSPENEEEKERNEKKTSERVRTAEIIEVDPPATRVQAMLAKELAAAQRAQTEIIEVDPPATKMQVVKHTPKRKHTRANQQTPSKRRKKNQAVDLTTPERPSALRRPEQMPTTPADGSDYEDGQADVELRGHTQRLFDSRDDLTKDEVMAKLMSMSRKNDQNSGRYFMGGDGNPLSGVKCHNCAKRGHLARDCAYSTHNTCFVCGSSDHSSWDCQEDPCDLCLQVGHDSSACQNEPVGLTLCTYCGSRDHQLINCPGTREPDDPNLRCMVCFEPGHLNCTGPRKAKTIVWCCQCGSKNHTMESCRNLPMSAEHVSMGLHGGRPRYTRMYKTCYHCASLRHIARNCPQQPPRSRWRRSYSRNNYPSRSSSLGARGKNSHTDRWKSGGYSSERGYTSERSTSSNRLKRTRNEIGRIK